MGAFKEQVKGAAQQVKGKVKETTGKAVGNPRLQVEGNLEKNVGKVRQSVARPMELMHLLGSRSYGTKCKSPSRS